MDAEREKELEECLRYKSKVTIKDGVAVVEFSKEMPSLFKSDSGEHPTLGNQFSFSFELPGGAVNDPGTDEMRQVRDHDIGLAINMMLTPLIGTIHSLFLQGNLTGMKILSDSMKAIANVVDANENMLVLGVPIDPEFASIEGNIPNEEALQKIAEQSLNMISAAASTMHDKYGKTLELSAENCSGKVVVKSGPVPDSIKVKPATTNQNNGSTDYDPNYQ